MNIGPRTLREALEKAFLAGARAQRDHLGTNRDREQDARDYAFGAALDLRRGRKKPPKSSRTDALFGPVAEFVRSAGACQVGPYMRDECDGPLEVMHARARGMGGARGDWIRDRGDGEPAGNVLLGCKRHHEWCDEHKETILDDGVTSVRSMMETIAELNGSRAMRQGIEPVFD